MQNVLYEEELNGATQILVCIMGWGKRDMLKLLNYYSVHLLGLFLNLDP